MKYLTLDVKQPIHPKHIVFFLHSLGVSIQLVGGLLPVGRCSCHMTFCNEVIHLYKILGILINQILLASTKTSTQAFHAYSGQELAPQYKKNLSIADRVMGQLL
jgi:hypothetical protein